MQFFARVVDGRRLVERLLGRFSGVADVPGGKCAEFLVLKFGRSQ